MSIARKIIVVVLCVLLATGGFALLDVTGVTAGSKPAPVVKPYDPLP
jgi:hypothetical protein